jgi:hypothetical protein
MNKKRKNHMGNCVDCGKEVYCGTMKGDIFCRECAMLRNLKMFIAGVSGKEV